MDNIKKITSFLVPMIVGIIIWFIPVPEGLKPEAWHLLAIFVATIVGIICKPMPMGAVAIVGITAAAFTKTLTIKQSLSGFSNTTIWLIVVAFFIARGFIKTGLGARIGYLFMRLLGKKTLGLSYGLVVTDLVLSPTIPSNTARGGGVISPILVSVAEAYQSRPDDGTARKLGSFLTLVSFQGIVITSAMFLTSMAANPLAAKFAAEQGVDISWGQWALAASVPGIISLIFIPWLIYMLHKPEITETPQAVSMAQSKLKAMGGVSAKEWSMLIIFIGLLTMWIFGRALTIHGTLAALIGLVFLLATNVLTWKDILNEKGAWDTLVWFAALVMMASFLNTLGLIPWFSNLMGVTVGGFSWIPAFLGLSLVYFYSHYFFASNTAHISAMYAAFLVVAIAVGTPPMLAALVLAFFGNLMSSMTHYGTGPAPVYFGYGYVSMGTWWKLGFICSVVNIFIWLVFGGIWWKVLGLW